MSRIEKLLNAADQPVAFNYIKNQLRDTAPFLISKEIERLKKKGRVSEKKENMLLAIILILAVIGIEIVERFLK